jgi:hypothetical protein
MEKQATHFIEVWRFGNSFGQSRIYRIDEYKRSMNDSIRIGIKTIAIFKIYPKNK